MPIINAFYYIDVFPNSVKTEVIVCILYFSGLLSSPRILVILVQYYGERGSKILSKKILQKQEFNILRIRAISKNLYHARLFMIVLFQYYQEQNEYSLRKSLGKRFNFLRIRKRSQKICSSFIFPLKWVQKKRACLVWRRINFQLRSSFYKTHCWYI